MSVFPKVIPDNGVYTA